MKHTNWLQVEAEETQCYELHNLEGRTYRYIAEKVGISLDTVYHRIHAAAERYHYPRIQDARKASLQRHYNMLALCTDELNNGRDPLPIIDRLIKIEASIRALLRLDEPIKVEQTVQEVTQEDVEFAELVREENARNTQREAELGHPSTNGAEHG